MEQDNATTEKAKYWFSKLDIDTATHLVWDILGIDISLTDEQVKTIYLKEKSNNYDTE